MTRKLLAFLAAFALTGCAASYDQGILTLKQRTPEAGPVAPVTVGIIAINDFHGALEPPHLAVPAPDGTGGSVPVPAGGAAWLASAIDKVRHEYSYSLTVSAGDLTGASQLASSLFLDEPAVGVMNRIGLDFNAVGNHEFDRGWHELERLQKGGCEKLATRDPCAVEPGFKGASYRYLAANVDGPDGQPIFPASAMRFFGSGPNRVSVGVIGLTLKSTEDLVSAGGIAGLTFTDEARAINDATATLKQAGADAIVVLIHQGGRTSGAPDPNGCNALSGEIKPIIAQLDPRVDLVVSGHTHWAYVCDYSTIDPAHPVLLTSAGVYGELVTDIALTIDPKSGKVIAKQAHNIIVQSPGYSSGRGDVPNTSLYQRFDPEPAIAAYVKMYADAASAFTNRVIGRIDQPATKGGDLGSNSGGPLGNLIADAQLAATRSAGAQIAFMNPFGIRAPLDPVGNEVTFGALYKVQPFNNTLVTQTLTGAEIKAALEEGFDTDGPEQYLAPSAGFSFTVDHSQPIGSRIVSITFMGKPLDPAASYRVTTNSFLAGGGDSFRVFEKQRDAVIGGSDIDALEAWIKGVPVRAVPQEARALSVGG